MKEYPKIYSPYARFTEGPLRNKLDESTWSNPTLKYLRHNEWTFTEKIDGTNIRVHWDGHKVAFGGRTDNAQIPTRLATVLEELFPEELFEQAFAETPVTLYGEGYGPGIQKAGRLYGSDARFVLFDVLIDGWWLLRPNVEDVAGKLGLDVVPVILTGTLDQAVTLVRGGLSSTWGDFPAEGVVGVPTSGILDRAGKRITVKIKAKDFPALPS
jgi:hypothetical protein